MLAVAPLLTEDQFRSNLIQAADYTTQIYVLLIAMVGLGFVWKHASWVDNGTVVLHNQSIHLNSDTIHLQSENDELEQSHHSASFQHALFGVGSILYLVCDILNGAISYPEDSDIAMLTLIGVSYLACTVVAVIFFNKYNGVTLKQSQLVQYCIAFIIGGIISVLVSITVKPLWTLNLDEPTNSSNSTDSELNFESVIKVTGNFLQPFFVEFLSMSLGCLFSLWQTMRHSQLLPLDTYEDATSNRPVTNLQDYGAILHEENNSPSQAQDLRRHQLQKCLVCAMSIVISVCYFSVGLTDIFGVLFAKADFKVTTQSLIMMCVLLSMYLPGMIMILMSMKKLQSTLEMIPNIKQFTTAVYLLLLTAAAQFIFILLEFIAVLGCLQEDPFYIFCLFYMPLKLYRIWLQTRFILMSHYIHRSKQNLPKIAEFTLIYVIMLNLIEWFGVAFIHKWVEENDIVEYSVILVTGFGKVNSKLIYLTLNPLKEVYLFHSAVLAYEAQKVKHS